MKCRVSCFNKTALWKDLTRFCPAWILYSIALAIAAFVMSGGIAYRYTEWSPAKGMHEYLFYMGFISAGFALLNAQLLFGDLFNTKLTNALHALPLRRETWFGTHVIAGISFCLIPNLVLSLAFIPLLGDLWLVSLCWFGAVSLQYLFYFGLAVFACMCVGSRFAQGAIFCIGAFCGWLLYMVVSVFYIPLIPGITLAASVFYFLCPMLHTLNGNAPYEVVVKYYDGVTNKIERVTMNQNPEGWIYLVGAALIGIVLLALALVMYRKRNLEYAGDFIAVSWLKPVFLVLYTLAMGMAFLNGASYIGGGAHIAFMIAGLLVGYLSGTMFLERTAKVFHKRMFIGLATFAAVLLGSMGVVMLDPLDLEHWVPDPAQVKRVYFSGPGISYSTARYNSDGTINTQLNPVAPDQFTQIHQSILENELPVLETKPTEPIPTDDPAMIYSDVYYYGDYYYYYGAPQYTNGFVVSFEYELSIGVYLSRDYQVAFDSPAAQQVEKVMNVPYIALYGDHSDWQKGIDKFRIRPEDGSNYLWPTPEQSTALMNAIFADLEAGTAAQHDYFHEEGSKVYRLSLMYGDTNKSNYGSINITVYADMENTVRWLQEFGLLDHA